jgi:hypothetical protein
MYRTMKAIRSLALQLLRRTTSSAQHTSPPSPLCRDLLEDDRQLAWILEAGFGAMLYQATRADRDMPADRRQVLRAADLGARVLHANRIDTACEVIAACQALRVQVVLLKGISTSTRHYPDPHTRPMGDIDILVSERVDAVEQSLLDAGYIRGREQARGHHHSAPLLDPKREVWVELHSALFPESDPLRQEPAFHPGDVAASAVPCSFWGRQVLRLSDELQLAYTACAWMRDLLSVKMHPSFLPPLFDMAYLVCRAPASLDWETFLSRLTTQRARASAYVALGYLTRIGVTDASFPMHVLETSQRIVRRHEASVMYALFDKHVLGENTTLPLSAWHALLVVNTLFQQRAPLTKLAAVPWTLAFPPGIASRFTLSFQMARLARRLRWPR